MPRYEYRVPIQQPVTWWDNGKAELSNCPKSGWRRWVYLRLLWALRKLGVKVLQDHETYTAGRMITLTNEDLDSLMLDVYRHMMRMNEEPWFVLMSYELFYKLKQTRARDFNPYTFGLGTVQPDINYGMDGITLRVGPGIPVYVSRYVDKWVVVPKVMSDQREYQPFRWHLEQIQDRFDRFSSRQYQR